MESNKAVQTGIYSGLIDKNSISLEQYRPRLLINDASKGQKVLAFSNIDLRIVTTGNHSPSVSASLLIELN